MPAVISVQTSTAQAEAGTAVVITVMPVFAVAELPEAEAAKLM